MHRNIFARSKNTFVLLILAACLLAVSCKPGRAPVVQNRHPMCSVHMDSFDERGSIFAMPDRTAMLDRAAYLALDYARAIKQTLECQVMRELLPNRLPVPDRGGRASSQDGIYVKMFYAYNMKNPILNISRITCDSLRVKKMEVVNRELGSHVRIWRVMDCIGKTIYDNYTITVDDPRGGRFTMENPMVSDGQVVYFGFAGNFYHPHSRRLKYMIEEALGKREAGNSSR